MVLSLSHATAGEFTRFHVIRVLLLLAVPHLRKQLVTELPQLGEFCRRIPPARPTRAARLT